MNALIVADGDVPTRAAVDRLLGDRGVQLVIAADGGALKAESLGFHVDVVVGDADSLAPADVERFRSRWRGGRRASGRTRTRAIPSSRCARRCTGRNDARSSSARSAVPGSSTRSRTCFCWRRPTLTGCDVRPRRRRERSPRCSMASGTLTIEGSRATSCRSSPLTPVVDGVTTDGLDYPLIDEALSRARRAAYQTH